MTTDAIPIAKPRLPTAEMLLPYLAEIDRNGIYANHGPLNTRFETKLAAHFGLSQGCAVTVASATCGITLALMASEVSAGKYCVLPSWTFAASGHAVLAAGLEPYFVDVAPDTWMLKPETVGPLLERLGDRVGAVLAVSPFGAPVDTLAWDAFSQDSGIPVVIDAAGSFDAATPGRCPVVISLHATKVLASGEGGFVISTDAQRIAEISQRANFGFFDRREAELAGMNGKMSEYHAAVGLASLAVWDQSRHEFMDAIAGYQHHASERIRFQRGFGVDWIGSCCVVELGGGKSAQTAAAVLAAKGIATRAWYGNGLHTHAAFRHCTTDGTLPITRQLASSTLGLPLFRGLDAASIEAVVNAL